MLDQKKIGEFLKKLRKEKGLTQQQLSEMLGVSDKSISRWENGKNLPDLSILIQLTEIYDLKLGELIFGERTGGGEDMELNENEVLLQVAEYYKNQQMKFLKGLNILVIFGVLSCIGYILFENSAFNDFCIGIMCAVIVTIEFIIIFYVFYESSELGSSMAIKRRVESPEKTEVPATVVCGLEGIGGWICVDEDGLEFMAHKYNLHKEQIQMPFHQVNQISDGKSLGIIPNRIIVEMKSGEIYKFILEEKDRDLVKKLFQKYNND